MPDPHPARSARTSAKNGDKHADKPAPAYSGRPGAPRAEKRSLLTRLVVDYQANPA